ncbi:MAG TPA: ABC transporter ATP-binding protein [Anaeromyxobacteraceae bacterium]
MRAAGVRELAARAVIQAQDLERDFPMGDSTVRALRGVSFRIDPGEYVAITGPSGSGKTTLMNLIGCLDSATSGTYWLDGEEVSLLDDDALSHVRNEKIGFVFQTFNLLQRATALDNVALPLLYAEVGRRERRAAARRALERVELTDRTDHRPDQLSGGQRQRVAIARALVNEPKLLLADEPTGALDQRTGAEIIKLFEQLNREGVTIVLVTHDPEIARRTRRQLRLVDGAIVADEVLR